MDLSKIITILVVFTWVLGANGASTADKVENLLNEKLDIRNFKEIDLSREKDFQEDTYQVVIERLRSKKSIEKEDESDLMDIEMVDRKKMVY